MGFLEYSYSYTLGRLFLLLCSEIERDYLAYLMHPVLSFKAVPYTALPKSRFGSITRSH